GMHGIDKAAAFIKSNMPLSQGGSLSDQQAWDVSFYINSQERPQDPRFKGDLGQTTREYHGKYSQYGLASPVDGHLLGSKAY
ncbi:MAG: cytochrome C, partial [Aeromonas sp.]